MPLEDHVLRLPVGIAHALAFLEIGAGAEGALARAGQDDAPYVVRVRKLAPQRQKLASHLRIERVRRLRPVERDAQHRGLDPFGKESLVLRHGRTLFAAGERVNAGARYSDGRRDSRDWVASSTACQAP